MHTGPIVDSHVHFWDPGRLQYPWLHDSLLLNRPYGLEDYSKASAPWPIEALVFVQAEVDAAQFKEEAAWVAGLAQQDTRLEGLVAWAPLEAGEAVRDDLEDLKQHSILRGIRRVIQYEPDLNFCLRPDFIAGVRTLSDYDLTFDLCVDHRHLAQVLKLAERVPDVRMAMDHIGKPDIKRNSLEPWRQQLSELAHLPQVYCKISGVATEADYGQWTHEQLKVYILEAIEAFGFERVMFGSDWPVSLQAIEYGRWIELLDTLLTGVGEKDQRRFWHDNAVRFYGLDR